MKKRPGVTEKQRHKWNMKLVLSVNVLFSKNLFFVRTCDKNSYRTFPGTDFQRSVSTICSLTLPQMF